MAKGGDLLSRHGDDRVRNKFPLPGTFPRVSARGFFVCVFERKLYNMWSLV